LRCALEFGHQIYVIRFGTDTAPTECDTEPEEPSEPPEPMITPAEYYSHVSSQTSPPAGTPAEYNSEATTPARKVIDLPQPPPLGTLIPKSPYLSHLYPEGAPQVWEAEDRARNLQGSGGHVPRIIHDLVPLITIDGTKSFSSQEASRVRYTFFSLDSFGPCLLSSSNLTFLPLCVPLPESNWIQSVNKHSAERSGHRRRRR